MRTYPRPFICFITLVLFFVFCRTRQECSQVRVQQYNGFSVPLHERNQYLLVIDSKVLQGTVYVTVNEKWGR
jgi:hypothetical protein